MINNKILKKAFLVLLISLLFVGIGFSQTSEGKTIYVDDIVGEGPNNPLENYTDLKSAVENSTDGDVIYVYSGSYTLKNSLVINKSISIIGQEHNSTFLNISTNEDIIKDCIIQIESDDVKISEFTISPVQNLFFRVDGIRVFADNSNIYKNKFMNLVLGIYMKNANNSIVDNNIFQNNSLGISSYINTEENEYKNNTFLGNYNGGMSLFYEQSSNFFDNSFIENNDFGLNLVDSENNTINGNIFNSNKMGGIRFSRGKNNIISYNQIEDNSRYGIFLLYSSANNIYSNLISDHKVGVNISSDSFDNILIDNEFSGNNIDVNETTESELNDNSKNGFSELSIYFVLISLFFWLCFFIFLRKISYFLKNEKKENRKSNHVKKVDKENISVFNVVLFDKKLIKNKMIGRFVIVCRLMWLLGFFTLIVAIVIFFL